MKIFVLLGTQDAPFPRLIQYVENGVKQLNIICEIIVQAGHTSYESESSWMKIVDFLQPAAFESAIMQADVVICHGGAGTMLTALKHQKPTIAMARKLAFAEHNNDHQCELVDKLADDGYLQGVQTESELVDALQKIMLHTHPVREFDLVNGVTDAVAKVIDSF